MKQINVKYLKIEKSFVNEYRNGFVNVFKIAFAGPPYFEFYQVDEVLDSAWKPYLRKGCIYLALNNNQVIGLSCCLPIIKIDQTDPNISALESLRSFPKLPLCLDDACYMSELAVLPEFRRLGIGTELIIKRLSWARKENMKYYILRTAAEGSNSLSLYSRLGAQIIPSLQQDVSNIGVSSASKKRIFLFGRI